MARRAEREWTSQLERQEAQWKAEAEQQRQRLEAEMTRQQAQWQAAHERQQAEWKAAHDRQQQELESEARWAEQRRRRELEKERSQDFVDAIERGDAGFLAIYLGQHPEEAGKIIDLIIRREEAGEETRQKLLADLYHRNVINEADFEGRRESLAAAFLGMITRPDSTLFKVNTTVEVESLLSKESAAIGTDRPPTPEPADD